MNKKRVLIIVIMLMIFSVVGCTNNSKEYISKNIEMNLDNCKIAKEKDSHGGLLGDGEYFAKVECSKINYDELSNNWKSLPLTESIDKVMTMVSCYSDGCKDVYERFSIPNITNGYYYFLDRHSMSTDKYDDRDLNNRSSWNFNLALLDKDTNIIYYYELDT